MRVILTGGGTGGHIYPALALAEVLRQRDPNIKLLYIGSEQGPEGRIVPAAGIPFAAIPARGLVGKGAVDKVKGFWSLARGIAAARSIVARARPDVIVGTGGYVAGPVGLVAGWRRLPLVIHEQNAFPSTTNRWLSRWAHTVAVPFAAAKTYFPRARQVVVTGNPVRPAVLEAVREEARRQLGLTAYAQVILVMSGSGGARRINQAVVQLAAGLPSVATAAEPTALIVVTGQRYYETVCQSLAQQGLPTGDGGPLRVYPYLDNMEQALAAADLVVSRAGAVSLAEITARGLPAVIVPSPNVTHDHQRRNAAVLAQAGAAVVIEDENCSGPHLLAVVSKLLADGEGLASMADISKQLGVPDAAQRLADLVYQAGGHKFEEQQA